jgi:hypothetical protein
MPYLQTKTQQKYKLQIFFNIHAIIRVEFSKGTSKYENTNFF